MLNTSAIVEWTVQESGEYVDHVNCSSDTLVWSQSNGTLWTSNLDLSQPKFISKGDGSYTIEALKVHENRLASVDSIGSLNLWDIRQPSTAVNKTNLGCPGTSLSISADGSKVATGTAAQPDAKVTIYDVRNLKKPVVDYVDSHNDDITDIRWHPTRQQLLLSGSTDGVINLFDTNCTEEDDAVIQAFNPGASLHQVDFLSPTSILSLSHMETLQVYSLLDDSCKDYGDLRDTWSCEYVAGYSKGYFLAGSNNQSSLRLVSLESKDDNQSIELNNAHGEEVCRDFVFGADNRLYTAGEDGKVKLWTLPAPTVAQPSLPRKKHHHKHKHHKSHHHKKPY